MRAVSTPGPNPIFAIVKGITNGNTRAPIKGVNATKKRNINYKSSIKTTRLKLSLWDSYYLQEYFFQISLLYSFFHLQYY